MDLMSFVIFVAILMPIVSLLGMLFVFLLQLLTRNAVPKNANVFYAFFRKGLLIGLTCFLVSLGGCAVLILFLANS